MNWEIEALEEKCSQLGYALCMMEDSGESFSKVQAVAKELSKSEEELRELYAR